MSKGDARLQVTQWDSAPPLREGSQAQAMSDVIFLLWSVKVIVGYFTMNYPCNATSNLGWLCFEHNNGQQSEGLLCYSHVLIFQSSWNVSTVQHRHLSSSTIRCCSDSLCLSHMHAFDAYLQ
jgi:hypothetical protein